VVLALALLALGGVPSACEGSRLDVAPDATEPAGDTSEADTGADVELDTAPPDDTGAHPDASDTSDPADAEDTAGPEDTDEPLDVGDTSIMEDTGPDDTAAPEDTAGPEDALEPPGCVDAADCADHPAGPCEEATCDLASGACVALAAREDEPCEDGNLCTMDERCLAGVCVPGAAVVCHDANPCTDDVCLPGVGCVFSPNFAACDDGDPCTTGSRCLGGSCWAGSFACDDGNPCTADTCAPDGTCSNTPDDALPCSDGSACTLGDRCEAGACLPGEDDGCDDGNPCTATACAADGLSCEVVPLDDLPCDDGDVCTVGDRCEAGVCVPGPARDCGGHPDCVIWGCDPVTGCALIDLFEGAPCDELSLCSEGDTCDADGECVPLVLVTCDDDNPCTDDTCDPLLGCVHTPRQGPCDDGDACTVDDLCQGGACVGTPRVCDDGDACTFNSCDPLTGCEFLPGGVVCDDGDPCTIDSCDPGSGCVFEPTSGPCDDGDACTEASACQPDGACVGAPIDCDDGDPCTLDHCDPELGCVNTPFSGPCDDGDACTEGASCDDLGACVGGTPVDPDDGVDCTHDVCDPELGVINTPDSALCPIGEACEPGLGCVPEVPLILFSRVMLDPESGDGALGDGQWLVITNAGQATIDLTGFRIFAEGVDASAALHPLDGEGPLLLAPGASLAAYKAAGAPPAEGEAAFGARYGAAGDGFHFALGGDRLELLDASEVRVDGVALTPLDPGPTLDPQAFPSIPGLALSLDATALAWAADEHANDDPLVWCATPASPEAPPVDCGRARLNEIRLGGPDGERWIELHLPFGAPVDGLTIRVLGPAGQVAGILEPSGRMPALATFLLRDGLDGVTVPRLGAGAVQLLRDGELLDVYGFGALTAPVDATLGLPLFEGTPGPAQGEETVAWRAVDGVDTDDNVADWVVGVGGSPGALNAP